ncbi:MAG: ABC transporter ATP-binding protein [Euryarchaeota archaeon]|nr:ABC transporter ATP-binding protein [Euryarchaeota archaeon]MDE1837344.1 ABC transporter ATP-binding protein [Euryarchaeota archaeon]MDE1880924.1 ABC transporter ATP-binding protein [Euryarchaeota archaeon]MDE2045622.1 ABC transporter ATP-binding protein [Thermoplasmata archaeon]
MSVIEAQALGKTYPGGTRALQDVSLSVREGEIYCLLGRNGAGKTTLLRILATQLAPNEGTARVMGHDVVRDPWAIRDHIAVVPQGAIPHGWNTPDEAVYRIARIRGVAREEARRRTDEVLRDLDLWEHRHKMIFDLSGGTKQRVVIAYAFVVRPELLFLDEPTIGLDPIARRGIWRILRRLKRDGCTFLLTSHYLDEVEALADRLAIIDRGRVLFEGTVHEAITGSGSSTMVDLAPPSSLQGANGHAETIAVRNDEELLAVVQRGQREGRKVSVRPPSLEDAFMRRVGGPLDEPDG